MPTLFAGSLERWLICSGKWLSAQRIADQDYTKKRAYLAGVGCIAHELLDVAHTDNNHYVHKA
ncbi:MAG: hypothetical protein ACLP5H_29445 [Desulfomonilaceae bacterium]